MSESDDKSSDRLNSEESFDLTLSHNQLFSLIDTHIESITRTDPLLSHLPTDITSDELEDMIGHQLGRSMAVLVERNNSSVRVIVDNNSNVKQLKKSIETYFSLHYKRHKQKLKRRINWRFVWRTYSLVFNGQEMNDQFCKLKDLGVFNKSKISFIRKSFHKT